MNPPSTSPAPCSSCCPSTFFYGWIVVLAAGLACICSFPGNTFGIAFFIPHLRHELHLSHVEIALVWGAGVFIVALLLPFVGKIVDWQGPWRVLAATTLPLALATLTMSWVQTWWQLLLLIAVMRMFGVGLIYVAAVRATNHWFKVKRGRVSVLLIICFYATMALPSIVSWLIAEYGWRATYRIVAVAMTVGMGGVLSLIRDSPLMYGLLVDGASVQSHSSRSGCSVEANDTTTTVELVEIAPPKTVETIETIETVEQVGYGMKEATHTLIFWILALNIFVVELYWCACQFNMLLLLGPESKRAQLLESQVVVVMVVLSVASGCGSVFAGWAIEKLQLRRAQHGIPHRRGLMVLVSMQMVLTMASAIVVVHIRSMAMAVVWGLLFSFMIGIQDVVMLVAFAEIFGKEKIGEIMGLVTAVMTLGTVGGPVLGAIVLESGDLEMFFYPMAACAGALAVGCHFVQDPIPARKVEVLHRSVYHVAVAEICI